MINFNDATKENMKEHNPNWPQIPDHHYRVLIMGVFGFEKNKAIIKCRESSIRYW